METFYRLNPKKLQRYQPYMIEWINQSKRSEDEVGWVNGVYVARAIGSALPKGSKYPEQPLELFRPSSEMDDEETYVMTDADRFAAFALQYNRRFEKDPEPIDIE